MHGAWCMEKCKRRVLLCIGHKSMLKKVEKKANLYFYRHSLSKLVQAGTLWELGGLAIILALLLCFPSGNPLQSRHACPCPQLQLVCHFYAAFCIEWVAKTPMRG